MFPAFASLLLVPDLPKLTAQNLRLLEQPAIATARETSSPRGYRVVPTLVAPATSPSPTPEAIFTPPFPLQTEFTAPSLARMREGMESKLVRPLPGQLDEIPVFNSNSPEMVRSEGILLSTFPAEGKRSPEAHLNYALQGRFDLFAHHVTQTDRPNDVTTLFLGILLYNPGQTTVSVNLLQAASFLSTPDAPFRNLPSLVDNPTGYVYSGPGSRVMNQVLRGRRQSSWPSLILIPPGQSRMLANLPIPLPKLRMAQRPPIAPAASAQLLINPLGEVQAFLPLLDRFPPQNQTPSSNGRSTFMQLQTNGPIYAASMALYSRMNLDGTERQPTVEDWESLLVNGRLSSPRDIPPSPTHLSLSNSRFFYGRVAGISQGSSWRAKLTDAPNSNHLTIPRPGQAFSYGVSTVQRGTLGTGQIQSAPMLARYPDTAYFANGNYGVHYDLSLPLENSSRQMQSVALSIQTPIKQDQLRAGLDFLDPPAPQIFFRGTVRVSFADALAGAQTRYLHLVQRRGQRGEPLALVNLQPGERRTVEVDFLYPPDATPPQVLTVSTLLKPHLLTKPNSSPATSSTLPPKKK
jgi:hypothetical protein